MCIVQISEDKDGFLEVGRQIERIWLTATKYDLSVQLNTGIFFFWQGINTKNTASVFSDIEKKDITTAYNSIASVCNNKNSIITAIIRIGHGEKPTTKSTKSTPIIKWG